jgi:hypothetical protein
MTTQTNNTNRTEHNMAKNTKFVRGALIARAKYADQQAEANNLIARLRDLMADHTLGEPADWAHVGDMGQVIEYLKNAVDFMADEE